MDADEREVFDYLQTFGEDWVSAREVCRRAGGKKRYAEDNNWAKPILHRLKQQLILEGDQLGRYRVKPAPSKGHKGRWVSPDIEKILQEGGITTEVEQTEEPSDDHSEPT